MHFDCVVLRLSVQIVTCSGLFPCLTPIHHPYPARGSAEHFKLVQPLIRSPGRMQGTALATITFSDILSPGNVSDSNYTG